MYIHIIYGETKTLVLVQSRINTQIGPIGNFDANYFLVFAINSRVLAKSGKLLKNSPSNVLLITFRTLSCFQGYCTQNAVNPHTYTFVFMLLDPDCYS